MEAVPRAVMGDRRGLQGPRGVRSSAVASWCGLAGPCCPSGPRPSRILAGLISVPDVKGGSWRQFRLASFARFGRQPLRQRGRRVFHQSVSFQRTIKDAPRADVSSKLRWEGRGRGTSVNKSALDQCGTSCPFERHGLSAGGCRGPRARAHAGEERGLMPEFHLDLRLTAHVVTGRNVEGS